MSLAKAPAVAGPISAGGGADSGGDMAHAGHAPDGIGQDEAPGVHVRPVSRSFDMSVQGAWHSRVRSLGILMTSRHTTTTAQSHSRILSGGIDNHLTEPLSRPRSQA